MSAIWLYEIPLWVLGTLVIGSGLVYTVGGLFLARRWVDAMPSSNDSVGAMLSIAGVAYAVLLAMIAVEAWNGVAAVEASIQSEANALSGIYRNVEPYRAEERDHIRRVVRDYIDFVIRDEWPALRRGSRSPRTELAAQRLNNELTTFEARSDAEQMVHPLVLDQAATFTEARQLRLLLGTRGMSAVTWVVVVLGGLITMGFAFFFRTDAFGMHVVLSCFAGAMLGILIFLIVAMDHPLWGEFSVQPQAFREALQIFETMHISTDTTVAP
ncbi:MAG TPA: DUF4239 domain-containing protein [Longimicrobium sp.]|nr:DUF4239 domain-containing protein [Longimicrobium sp.]